MGYDFWPDDYDKKFTDWLKKTSDTKKKINQALAEGKRPSEIEGVKFANPKNLLMKEERDNLSFNKGYNKGYKAAMDFVNNNPETAKEMFKLGLGEPIEEKATRHNQGKLKWSVIDFKSLEPLVRVRTWGDNTYGSDNWKKGMDKKEILESLMRHLVSLIDGELYDLQTNELHIGHIMANAMFWSYYHRKEEENKKYIVERPALPADCIQGFDYQTGFFQGANPHKGFVNGTVTHINALRARIKELENTLADYGLINVGGTTVNLHKGSDSDIDKDNELLPFNINMLIFNKSHTKYKGKVTMMKSAMMFMNNTGIPGTIPYNMTLAYDDTFFEETVSLNPSTVQYFSRPTDEEVENFKKNRQWTLDMLSKAPDTKQCFNPEENGKD